MLRATTLLILFHLACTVQAQLGPAPDPLFRNDEVLAATLTAPLTTLLEDRPTEYDLQGTFEVQSRDESPVLFDIKIRTRGHLRHEVCDFPPLRVNFKKSQTKDTLFEKQDKLKLVVHCDDAIRYEQAVIREHLAYRVLNVLTPLSFRVRLLRVRYIDSESRRDDQVRYAFLLEHKNRLGKRIDRKDLKIEETSVDTLEPSHLNLTSVFQYFIGNTDFSPIAKSPYDECCHNYDLFGGDSGLLIAVPYDFDQAGFVNAPYAAPGPQFRINSVRQRVYRGRCVNNDRIEDSVQQFKDERQSIYALLEQQQGLTTTTRKSIISYTNRFYSIIDDDRKVQRFLIDKCI